MDAFKTELESILPDGFTYTVSGTTIEVKKPDNTVLDTYDVSKHADRTKLKTKANEWAQEKDKEFTIDDETVYKPGSEADALVAELGLIVGVDKVKLSDDKKFITITTDAGDKEYNITTHEGRTTLKKFAREEAEKVSPEITIGTETYPIDDSLVAALTAYNDKLTVTLDDKKVLTITPEGGSPATYKLSSHKTRTSLNEDIKNGKFKTKEAESKIINVGNSEYDLADEKQCKLLLAALLMSNTDNKRKISFSSPNFTIGTDTFSIENEDDIGKIQDAAKAVVEERNKEGIKIKVGNANYNLSNEQDRTTLIADLATAGIKLEIDGNNYTLTVNDDGVDKSGTFDITKLADRTNLQYFAGSYLKKQKLFTATTAQQESYKAAKEKGITLVDIEREIRKAANNKNYSVDEKFAPITDIGGLKALKESYLVVELAETKTEVDKHPSSALEGDVLIAYNALTSLTEPTVIGKMIDALVAGTDFTDTTKKATSRNAMFAQLKAAIDNLPEEQRTEITNKVIDMLIKLERVAEERRYRTASNKNAKEIEETLSEEQLGG